ncbi:hypothetical protein ACEPAG_2673 [Sanghuangporus baumii]
MVSVLGAERGSFVSQGATRARMSGPYGNRNTSESREQTIENVSRKIRNVATVSGISEVVQTSTIRLYTLAMEHKFTKGRRNMNIVAIQVSRTPHLVKQATTKASGLNPFNDVSSNEDAMEDSSDPRSPQRISPCDECPETDTIVAYALKELSNEKLIQEDEIKEAIYHLAGAEKPKTIHPAPAVIA